MTCSSPTADPKVSRTRHMRDTDGSLSHRAHEFWVLLCSSSALYMSEDQLLDRKGHEPRGAIDTFKLGTGCMVEPKTTVLRDILHIFGARCGGCQAMLRLDKPANVDPPPPPQQQQQQQRLGASANPEKTNFNLKGFSC